VSKIPLKSTKNQVIVDIDDENFLKKRKKVKKDNNEPVRIDHEFEKEILNDYDEIKKNKYTKDDKENNDNINDVSKGVSKDSKHKESKKLYKKNSPHKYEQSDQINNEKEKNQNNEPIKDINPTKASKSNQPPKELSKVPKAEKVASTEKEEISLYNNKLNEEPENSLQIIKMDSNISERLIVPGIYFKIYIFYHKY